jgi:GNAT superfamily N-acetyltransferase
MADRLQGITTGGLPWIVALKKGNHSKNQHYKFVNEEIVGFANMDDHCDQGSLYRYTMEMEMYVHPEYLHQGVGKCLLDKMLELVDNGYRSRGGYEWFCNGAYLKSGATRIIKTVNLHFLHEHGSTSEVTWVAAFLRSFDFRKSGHLHNMGFKLGKTYANPIYIHRPSLLIKNSVDVTIFQYTTSEPIDAKARPHAPL